MKMYFLFSSNSKAEINDSKLNAGSLSSLEMDHIKCTPQLDIMEKSSNKGVDVGNKIQKSIRSFFTKVALDVSAATAVQNDCIAGHDTASEAVSEILGDSNLTHSILKVDLKSAEKGSETHLDANMDMGSLMGGQMDTYRGEQNDNNQEGKDRDALKNQEKENKMESSLTEVVSSCIRKSPERTPVLPTRKNPNRRISVTDLIVPSNENSDF
jgi:hypothetical protein